MPLDFSSERAAHGGVRPGGWLIVGIAFGCALAFGAASLRHSSSLAFPLDDGYIYSNYVLARVVGRPFEYNAGEVSGGITGMGWYAICVLFYRLLLPVQGLLGGLAPAVVRDDVGLAQQAGHLYLAAYVPGVIFLAVTALGVWRLAHLTLPRSGRHARLRTGFAWLLGAIAAADAGMVWGAMSGLEAALACALAVWAVALLVEEARRGALVWSLVLVALLPWARPDLLAIGLAGLAWLLLRGLWPSKIGVGYQVSGVGDRRRTADTQHPTPDIHGVGRSVEFRNAGLYAVAMLAGTGLLSLVYLLGWGKPLPSSFYAKVGGLRLGDRFFSAARELMDAGRWLPFAAGALAVLGNLVQAFWPAEVGDGGRRSGVGNRRETTDDRRRTTDPLSPTTDPHREVRLSAWLLFMVSAAYMVGIMATLSWFGQEDRYLLPVHPFVIVSIGMLVWRGVELLPVSEEGEIRLSRVFPLLAGGFAVLAIGLNYLWATRNYVVEVRNINDAHVVPARWIALNTPPDAVIASEPIGAVRLFSERRTVDLVGLTTPATLGTYQDWPRAWEALRHAGADYLLFYPNWFENGSPPPWAKERATFPIPDNRIAGDDAIAVYELDWTGSK
jgi:hypothetical protein